MEFGSSIVNVYAVSSNLGLFIEGRFDWNSINGDLGRVRRSGWRRKQKYVELYTPVSAVRP
jgi:hypothetical protein